MKIRFIPAAVGVMATSALAQDGAYRAVPIPPDAPRPVILPPAGDEPGPDMSWNTIDGGGRELSGALGLGLHGTVGQPDAGLMSGGNLEMGGGFWNLPVDPPVCYPNCDSSTSVPMLTANDFQCFLNSYAAGCS